MVTIHQHQGTKKKLVKRIENYKGHNLTITNLQSCNMIANHQLGTRHIKPFAQLNKFLLHLCQGSLFAIPSIVLPPYLKSFPLPLKYFHNFLPLLFPSYSLFFFFFTSLVNKSIKKLKNFKKNNTITKFLK